MGSSLSAIKNQGICQGNGAAPAAWTVISIQMISAHKRKGHGAYFISPISNLHCHLAGGLFVDVKDLFHIDIQTAKSTIEAHMKYCKSVGRRAW
jgi:hypothetical protein